MTPTPKYNRMEGGPENRDRVIEPHNSKSRLPSISPRTWKLHKYKVHVMFKIEPFLALPKGSSPSHKCKVKIAFPKKNLKLNFTLPIKKGVIYINISKEGRHLKLPIHINLSRC